MSTNHLTILTFVLLFSYIHSQSAGIQPIGQIYWDVPHAGLAKKLSLYFTLDHSLPKDQILSVEIPGSLVTSDHSYVLNKFGNTTDIVNTITGTGSPSYKVTLLTLKEDLLPGVKYKLLLDAGNSAKGSYGPVVLQTQASTDSNTVIYARNPAFGYVFLAAKPVQLTFTTGYLTSENKNTYPSESNLGYIEITSLGDFG